MVLRRTCGRKYDGNTEISGYVDPIVNVSSSYEYVSSLPYIGQTAARAENSASYQRPTPALPRLAQLSPASPRLISLGPSPPNLASPCLA